jgi:hypothetical protein
MHCISHPHDRNIYDKQDVYFPPMSPIAESMTLFSLPSSTPPPLATVSNSSPASIASTATAVTKKKRATKKKTLHPLLKNANKFITFEEYTADVKLALVKLQRKTSICTIKLSLRLVLTFSETIQ